MLHLTSQLPEQFLGLGYWPLIGQELGYWPLIGQEGGCWPLIGQEVGYWPLIGCAPPRP